MFKANLFLVGAQKAGTTALADWLGRHPEIELARNKEPDYFVFELPYRRVRDLEEYHRCCSGGGSVQYFLDASVSYLRHPEALRRILAYNLHAKLLVVLRHLHSSWAGALRRATLITSNSSVIYTPHGAATLHAWRSFWTRAVVGVVERILKISTDAVIALSDQEAMELRRLGYKDARIVRMDNTILPLESSEAGAEDFARERKSGRSFRFGFLGRLSLERDPVSVGDWAGC
ncbi:MAG: hypothetical protein KatS3mg082_3414 [Nitrospiraceae bacterium]|nr:MAG: hypothetical protein KatS3mg082_3414 [Nitrospiraceae bacterium]